MALIRGLRFDYLFNTGCYLISRLCNWEVSEWGLFFFGFQFSEIFYLNKNPSFVAGTLFLIKEKLTVIEENSGKSQFQPSCVPPVFD